MQNSNANAICVDTFAILMLILDPITVYKISVSIKCNYRNRIRTENTKYKIQNTKYTYSEAEMYSSYELTSLNKVEVVIFLLPKMSWKLFLVGQNSSNVGEELQRKVENIRLYFFHHLKIGKKR